MISSCIAALFLLAGAALAMPKAGLQVSPAVSPSVLEEYFINISKTALVFPDFESPNGRVMLVDAQFKECMAVWGTASGNGWAVLNNPCRWNDVTTTVNQLIWLKHAGDGYINLALTNTKCIGTGYNSGAGVYTGDWCDSVSHQFAIIPIGNAFSLVQKETQKCLSTVKNTPTGGVFPLIVTNCNSYDDKQRWRACDLSGVYCWPTHY